MLPRLDCIAAIATAPGRGGIGVVRVSGGNIALLISEILGQLLPPRCAIYASFLDAQKQKIDQGIALFFPAPLSYTAVSYTHLTLPTKRIV